MTIWSLFTGTPPATPDRTFKGPGDYDTGVQAGEQVEMAWGVSHAGDCSGFFRRHRSATIRADGHVICDHCGTDHGPYAGCS